MSEEAVERRLDRLPSEFSAVAPDDRISAAVAALDAHGIRAFVVESGAEARSLVRSLLPVGAEVYNNTSRTLEAIGVADDIEGSGRYQPLRPRLYRIHAAARSTHDGHVRRGRVRGHPAREFDEVPCTPTLVVHGHHARAVLSHRAPST